MRSRNAYSLGRDERFTRWCRDRGIDLFGDVATAEVEAARAPFAKKAAAPSRSVSELIGLDMTEARILPQTFDEMTVEEAREILGRIPANRTGSREDDGRYPPDRTPRHVRVPDPRRHRGVIADAGGPEGTGQADDSLSARAPGLTAELGPIKGR